MPMALTRRTSTPSEVRIYHICPVANLASIVACGELCPLSILQARGIVPHSIAYSHLQQRRDALRVPIPPGGGLHDYGPWSFAARSPMLYTTARGALDSETSQRDIVHLVSDVARVLEMQLPFVFTDGHPLTNQLTRFESDVALLPGLLDWDVLLDPWWNNTLEDSDRKRKRQAEFLIHGPAPWPMVRGIAVQDAEARRAVEQIVAASTCRPKVLVLPEWYY